MKTNDIQVSVVIIQYNPCFEKLVRTIYSVARQTDILSEIIISDDGSKEDYFDKIEIILKRLEVKNYIFVKNQKNQGTVKNFLSGLHKASGKYIYAISPGDMLFNDNTLKACFDFSERNDAVCIFGNAIYFSEKDNEVYIREVPNQPNRPDVFRTNIPSIFGKLAIAEGANICGASIFRERTYASNYIQKISNTAKYVEDATSVLLSAICGEKITYFDREVVWYEFGSGISTNSNPIWRKRIQEDIENTKLMIYKEHWKSRVLKFTKVAIEGSKYPIMRRIIRSLEYPLLTCIHILISCRFKLKMTKHDDELKKQLENLIALINSTQYNKL